MARNQQVQGRGRLLPQARFTSAASPYLAISAASLAITLVAVALTPDTLGALAAHAASQPLFLCFEFLPVFLCTFALYFLSGRVWAAASASSLLFFAMCAVNRFKILLRGDPFVPADLVLGGEVLSIAGTSEMRFGRGIFVLLGALVACNLALALFTAFPAPAAAPRVIGLVACAALSALAWQNVYASEEAYELIPVEGNAFDMVSEFNSRGFLFAFLHHAGDLTAKKPEGYTEARALEALAKYGGEAGGAGEAEGEAEAEGFRPDVIFLMSEAFWDVTQIPGLAFEEDPIPNFRRLEREAITGNLYVSVFGGGTDNTEFSVLTGHSPANFGAEVTSAYKTLVRHETDSIARAFLRAGYRTLALHPNYKWFYNRDNVYKWLGFERFVGLDAFDEARDNVGNYVGDAAMTAKLIEEYEALAASGAPVFAYATSIQNHGPYDGGMIYGQIPENHSVRDGYSLDAAGGMIVTNYVRGLMDADAALGALAGYLEGSARPCVLVFFGDHLPLMGYDYSVYRQLGYTGGPETGLAGFEEIFRERYVIWANGAARGAWAGYDGLRSRPNQMSANYLGGFVLEALGIPGGAYQGMLGWLRGRLPVVQQYFYSDSSVDGEVIPHIVPPGLEGAMEDYRLAQYYKLVDERVEG
jgi:phosphoglycerol transferase MdoB-like AlkP superfamily enzyme